MKRIMWWTLSTLTAVVLMFGYHTSTSGIAAPTTISAISSGTTSGPSGSGATGSPAPAASTVTGSAVATRYGPVQVAITVAGSTITDVSVPQYPSSSSKDVQINQRALPTLIQETLDSQSASVDMVSGATYTSDGYRQSLQSALDQAGL